MARPERKDADYFPFYAKDGRTLFILENKYQCKGTGFFTNVMRFLTLQTDHHFCIKDKSDELYFFAKTCCDVESGIDMLNIMANTGKIFKSLWVSYQVIASPDLLTSLLDAYKNRKNPIITIEEIQQKYITYPENPITYPENQQEPVVSYPDKPQRKGKETKGKEIKEIYKDKDIYMDCVFLTKEEYQKLIDKEGELLTIKAIEVLNNYKMSSGKKYKSDYHALLNWGIEKAKALGTQGGSDGRNYGSSKQLIAKTGRARSDNQPYPIDFE